MASTRFAQLKGLPVSSWLSEPARMDVTLEAAETPEAETSDFTLEPLTDSRPPGSPALRVRQNQKDLSADDWAAFVRALETIAHDDAEPPSWHDLVQIHIDAMTDAGMGWGVHQMEMGMPGEGRNFLAWHREYLGRMEERLRRVGPNVVIPYWNWVNERMVPSEISNSSLLERLGITRYPSSESLPQAHEIIGLLEAKSPYLKFQADLEEGPHNSVHRFVGGRIADPAGQPVGGTMATSASPKDPAFWLHHAMVDNIWAHWQQSNAGPQFQPPNEEEKLEPSPLITGTVGAQLSVFDLGYTYA